MPDQPARLATPSGATYRAGSGCPAHARPVALDDVELARRARTTLAAAQWAQLVVADGGPTGCAESSVAVHDDAGEATVFVGRGSTIHSAARRRRHAALLIDADPDYGVGITLVGRLIERGGSGPADDRRPDRSTAPGTGTRAEPCGGSPAQERVAVSLTVDRVLASCPYDRVSVLTRDRRSIPLELYALVEPDHLAVEIARLTPHLNDGHADLVRALAVHASGVAAEHIVGARVSHLCREGLRLWWVGRNGATEQTIRFPRPATSVEEIGRLLQF